jgi:Glyoxalase-like domain
VAYQGPFDGGRTTLDGQVLKWQIGTPPSPDLPFLCGDITPRALRVREGEVRVHANGVTGVSLITVQVTDQATSHRRYAALLGASAGGDAALSLGPTRLSLQEGSGPQGVVALGFIGPQAADLPHALTHGAAMVIRPID